MNLQFLHPPVTASFTRNSPGNEIPECNITLSCYPSCF